MSVLYEFEVGDHDSLASASEHMRTELGISSEVLGPVNESMKCMKYVVSSWH